MKIWALVDHGIVKGTWPSDTKPTTAAAGSDWHDCGESPDPRLKAGWLYDGTTYSEPKPRELTSTQFFNRFTDIERAAIFGAAQASPQMLQFVVTAAAASTIDLGDPAVQGGVSSLIGGILTAPRAAAILEH